VRTMTNSLIPLLAADGPYGRGRIDNLVLPPVVHKRFGELVVTAVAVTVIWLIVLAVRKRPIDRTAKILIVVSNVTLMIQALIGIKLLDQLSGANQLYIHYIGGLIPLGLFVIASWIPFLDPNVRHVPTPTPAVAGDGVAVPDGEETATVSNRALWQVRILAVIGVVALASAVMSYWIGGAFAAGNL
jgi:heme A synthase